MVSNSSYESYCLPKTHPAFQSPSLIQPHSPHLLNQWSIPLCPALMPIQLTRWWIYSTRLPCCLLSTYQLPSTPTQPQASLSAYSPNYLVLVCGSCYCSLSTATSAIVRYAIVPTPAPVVSTPTCSKITHALASARPATT